MKKKLHYLIEYAQGYETITLFELTKLFGPSGFLLICLFLSPLLLFWKLFDVTVLVIAAFSIMCLIWYYFGYTVPLFDFLKKKTIESEKLVRIVNPVIEYLSKWQKWTEPACRYAVYWPKFQITNALIAGGFLLQIGFMDPSSIFPFITSLLLLIALLIEDIPLSIAGYLFTAIYLI